MNHANIPPKVFYVVYLEGGAALGPFEDQAEAEKRASELAHKVLGHRALLLRTEFLASAVVPIAIERTGEWLPTVTPEIAP